MEWDGKATFLQGLCTWESRFSNDFRILGVVFCSDQAIAITLGAFRSRLQHSQTEIFCTSAYWWVAQREDEVLASVVIAECSKIWICLLWKLGLQFLQWQFDSGKDCIMGFNIISNVMLVGFNIISNVILVSLHWLKCVTPDYTDSEIDCSFLVKARLRSEQRKMR